MSEMVPEGWNETQFSALLSERKERLPNDGRVPLFSLTIKDGISPKTARYEREFLVSDKGTKTYKVIHPNDLVFNPSNLRWGAIARSKVKYPVLASPIYEVVYPTSSDVIDPIFLDYIAHSDHMHLEYLHYMEGTLVERTALKIEHFMNLTVHLPPLPEQKKIASILTSVDEVIEKTQSQIDKLQDLKKGTMNELLTKGIGHTEFKESELGRIPKSWEVCALGEIGEFKNGVNKPKDAFGSGTKFVNISDAYPVDLDCRSLGRLEVTAQELVNYNLEVGDLVFVRSSVKLEGVAIPTIFKGFEEPVIFCGFMIRFRSRSTKVLPEFLREYLLTDEPRILIQRVATGGANININQEALSAFKVLLPTKDEQEYIVRKTNFANSQIAQLTLKCEKFQSLKKSLMQDLLTGKVRVSVN